MNKKLRLSFVFTFLVLGLLFSSVIVAAGLLDSDGNPLIPPDTKSENSVWKAITSGFDWVVEKVKTLASWVFGDAMPDSDAGEEAVIILKIFLFVIILLAIAYTLELSGNDLLNKPILKWMLSILVSSLIVRFLLQNDTLLNDLFFPYGVLGVAIASIVPLILFFFFVQKMISNKSLRKFAWIMAIVIFLIFWMERAPELTSAGITREGLGKPIMVFGQTLQSLIYPISALLALLFFLFDGTIRHWFVLTEIDRYSVENKKELLDRYAADLAELEARPGVPEELKAKMRKKLHKKIKNAT
ncbi:MAG: hypothetical protein KKF56_05840 [Nanoarchaeota archaeon]|nr:hypothetical protein [Nanoarchaeota archaeon]